MRVLWAILAVICLLGGCAVSDAGGVSGEMTLTFFGPESADAILLRWPEGAAMIDTGLNKYGARLVEFLQSNGVDRLDALIITHFDKDHVGGADSVIENIAIGRLLTADSSKDSKQYRQFLEAAEAANLSVERVTEDLTLELPGLALSINAPKALYEQENDRSLVVRAEWGECSFLFAGDAENDRLSDLLSSGVAPCTLLKVPHHGRYERLSEAFFQAAAPQWAVITSSAKEMEDEVVVGLLEAAGARVLLTREGDVTAVCDGRTLSVSQ